MAENEQQQPQYVYVPQPQYNEPEEFEIDLVELFKAVWKKRRFIFFMMVLFSVIAVAYALWLPNIYKAEAKIMPQGGKSGRLSGFAAAYGGLASMMGISMPEGAGGTGAVMVEILKGNSVVDVVMDKFNLMEEYEQETKVQGRKAVLKNFNADFDDKGSGIITVSYLHEDPQKAADIVNTFVEQLQNKMTEMSLSDAKQRRRFFEEQLLENQQELSAAEEAMVKYQQSSGVIALDEQAKKLIEAMSKLRSDIVGKSAEINSMKSYLRSDNPRLKLAESQLQAMQNELKKLEEEQRHSNRGASSGDIMLSVGEIPELGLEYQRRVRDLKAANAKYEYMLGQYESARLGEISDLSTITIIDSAMPPDFKNSPSRARIAIVGLFLGFFLPSGWISIKYIFKESQKFKAKHKRNDEDFDDYDDEDY